MTISPKSKIPSLKTGLATGTDRAKGGKTLVGELGQELVVDLARGRYYTVGTNGPEMVNIPKDAIVYNHVVTARILGKPKPKNANLIGNAKGLGDTVVAPNGDHGSHTVPGSNPENPPNPTPTTKSLKSIQEAYEKLNDEIERYIKLKEYAFSDAERAADFQAQKKTLQDQIDYYKQIIENCEKAIAEMRASGATDTSEELQAMQDALESARSSMYDLTDQMRTLFTDTLKGAVDELQSAFSTLSDAIDEINESGRISIDTFQSLLENGIQYLQYLKDENGEWDLSADKLAEVLALRKEQLAIETSLAYLSQIEEALLGGQAEKLAQLITGMNTISTAGWGLVDSQLEYLKALGLTEEQYQAIKSYLEDVKELSKITVDADISDLAKEIKKISKIIDNLNDDIDNMQSAVGTFETMLQEYNDYGFITLDTFQSLLENGVQYLSLLQDENGQYSLNYDKICQIIEAKTQELAIQEAINYLASIEAAIASEDQAQIAAAIGLTQAEAASVWEVVKARLAELEALVGTGKLTREQFEQIKANIEALQQISYQVEPMTVSPQYVSSLSDAADATADADQEVRTLADDFEDLNDQIEHFIAHQEFAYDVAERALDFDSMSEALAKEVGYYKRIMQEAEKAKAGLMAQGYDDMDEEIQRVEEGYWAAYRSMYEALDKIRSIRIEQLTTQLDELTDSYSNLHDAISEYNENGHISVDTFEEILDGGVQYLTMLDKEGEDYKINTDRLRAFVQARKEQLAVETALQYIGNIREAASNGETERLKYLLDATNEVTDATWDYVYAQAALLKGTLSDDQYNAMLLNIEKLRDVASHVDIDDEDAVKPVESLSNAFSELNKQIEHYIAHQEQAYKVANRAKDFNGMEQALRNEVEYYKQIMEAAEKTIRDLQEAGADDTSEELQSVETAFWNATNNMYTALDKIRSIRFDELKSELGNLTGAFDTLSKASDEYNNSGGITLSTFKSIADNGMQYLSLLDEENGQYVIATGRLKEYIAARRNQLAVETALSYVSNLREALTNGETERLRSLIDATNGISSSTWGYVYAQAALLKAEGLTNAQYDTVLANINKLRALSDSVIDDIAAAEDSLSDEYQTQADALNQILKYTEDLIRAEAKDRQDAINDEIDAYKEIIDLKKEALKTTKDEAKYEDEVADKVKEIAKLQAQADLLSLDTSREANAKRMNLMNEIAEKQKDLSDYQADHAYDAQIEALEKEADAYEESRQAEIDAIEASVSSEEKVYQLAIARIRDQWDTLYSDLIEWNTEQGSVINQEITDAWEDAIKAVERYGDAITAINAIGSAESAGKNYVVADIPKYHGGGVAGNKGKLNDEEVLAVLQKGELVVDKEQKKGLYTVVDFVKSLGERLGTKIGNLRNLGVASSMMPALAGMDAPMSAEMISNNNLSFNPSFNININGGVEDRASAVEYGRTIAETAANNLFDALNRRGINIVQTLRQ